MRILIISDTHRSHSGFDEALEIAGRIDYLIHLGDIEGGEYYIEERAGCPCYFVAGNNDFFSSLPRELEITLGGKRMFLTHGHGYRVSLGPQELIEEARARKADVVMFGHTHKPYLQQLDDLLVLNPGSLTYPRQEGREPSFMIMEVDKNGKISVKKTFLKNKKKC